MSRFDKYMIHVDVGTDEKLAGLTDAERLCHVVGVLAIAAKSPIRGYLIVGDEEATPTHVARRAALSSRVAASTIKKLTSVGILVRDDEVGALRVHNWERFNPEPKSDPTNAERQARWRAKNAGVTPLVTKKVTDESNGALTRAHAKRADAPSSSTSLSVVVEEPEGKNPSSPREAVEGPLAVVASAQARVTDDVSSIFDAWVEATERDPGRTQLTPDRRRRIAKALTSHGLDDCLTAVRNIGADAWARGENDRGQRYDDIEHALGKTERIERWRDRRTPTAPMSERERMQREMLEHAGVSL